MRKRNIEYQAFLQAAALWNIELLISDRKERSARTIVGQVKKQLGTSVQEQTVRRHVNAELDKEHPRLGCGCKSSVTSGIEFAIACGIKTFTNLSNASMKMKSTMKNLIARFEVYAP